MPKTPAQIDGQFAAFANSCETILTHICRESDMEKSSSENKTVVSDPLYTAIQEIIAACKAANYSLAHQLLGVKSLICGDKVPSEPFWESKTQEQNIYAKLDAMEYQAAISLNQIPKGMILLSSHECSSATEPSDPHQSPTLILMIEAYKKYAR